MEKHHIFIIGLIVLLIGGGLVYRHVTRDTDSRGATRLMRAIEQNDSLKATSKLIAKTQDINARDKKGQSALFYALKHSQDEELVRSLLMAGADADTPDAHGDTPILFAARNNPSAEIMDLLVHYGGDVHQTDKNGFSPLALAARYNTGEVITALLRTDASLDITDKNGKNLEDLIAENMKLSDMEKNNYRQVIFIVSLLEARAAAREARQNPEPVVVPAPAVPVKKELPRNTVQEEESAAFTEQTETEQAENQ